MTTMRVALAQTANLVGHLEENADHIAEAMRWAEDEGADVLVLPELALTGYPLSDLVLHEELVTDAAIALQELAAGSENVVSLVGTARRVPPRQTWDSRTRDVSISCALLSGGEVRGYYDKVLLPTAGGYDEGRTFAPGQSPDALWLVGDVVTGVAICEDLWSGDGPPELQAAGGARILLAPNASPYWRGKAQGRRRVADRVARRNGLPLVYVNFVGGQDELVFDGGSLVIDGQGELVYRSPEFAEDRAVIDLEVAPPRPVTGPCTTVHTRPLASRTASAPPPAPTHETVAGVWQALVRGTRDFVHRSGFTRAALGLSGGIDSAITAAVAAEALGAENVLGVAMPAARTSEDELEDATAVALALGIDLAVVPLGDTLDALVAALPDGRATAGLEARGRAAALHAVADDAERLVLSTVNKSELSVGQAVLHGDAAGSFAPLRDCPKTLLYELGRHLNTDREVIPQKVLDKPTTAQLTGDDAWPPPYEVLDEIVESYIEDGDGIEDLVAAGCDPDVTVAVLRRIDDAELLRRLTAPGVKVTARAFTHDRHVPLTHGWRVHRRTTAVHHPRTPVVEA